MALTLTAPSKTFKATSTSIVTYGFVYQDAATTVELNGVSARRGLMVAQSDVSAAGDLVECAANVPGYETYLKVDNIYSVGQLLMSTTGGLGTAVTATGNLIQAIQREASTAANDIVRVEFLGGVYYST